MYWLCLWSYSPRRASRVGGTHSWSRHVRGQACRWIFQQNYHSGNGYLWVEVQGLCHVVFTVRQLISRQNPRLIADEYASHGYYTLIPDLFQGDSIPMWILKSRDPTSKISFTEK